MPRARIQHRYLTAAGEVPDVSGMSPGEIVVNTGDGKAWTTDGTTLVEINGGTTVIQQPGGTGQGEVFKVRGQAGDYAVDPDDDFTLIVFVSGSTVTIPDNVTFPAGFKIWFRQDHATDYVFVQGGPSVTINSYLGYTGTAGQYATIELINIAGSNWMLRGEGAVKSAPAAGSYVPNKGIKFSDGNYFTDLNIASQVSDSKQMSFRAFVKLSQLTTGGEDPTPDPPPPPAQGNYKVFQQFLSKGRPSNSEFLANWGIDFARIHYGDEIWEGFSGGKPAFGKADPLVDKPLQATVEALAAATTEKYSILDLEQYPSHKGDSTTDIQNSVTRLKEVYGWYKNALPDPVNQFAGYYSEVISRDIFKSQNPGSADYLSWQAHNDLFQPLVNDVDIIAPSAYVIRDTQPAMLTMIREQLNEAARMATVSGENKITLTYLWPQYNTKNDTTLKYRYIPGSFWRAMLEECFAHAQSDGIVLWGLYGGSSGHNPSGEPTTYTDWVNASTFDWWAETQDFMATRVATQ